MDVKFSKFTKTGILLFLSIYFMTSIGQELEFRSFNVQENKTLLQLSTYSDTQSSRSVVTCLASCNEKIDCCMCSYDKVTKLCTLDTSGSTGVPTDTNTKTVTATKNFKEIKIRDCSDLPPTSSSGVYAIHPTPCIRFDVYCNMDTDGGGWTVFQRRIDGTTDFYRGWLEYENGFGDLNLEHWLGNRKLNQIVSTGSYKLRVDLESWYSEKYTEYSSFNLGDAQSNYTIEVDGHSGTAEIKKIKGFTDLVFLLRHKPGDSLHFPHDKRPFTTYDRDNDNRNGGNCAVDFEGAWWYNDCHSSNLNGKYQSNSISSGRGLCWFTYFGYYSSMKASNMMIKRLV